MKTSKVLQRGGKVVEGNRPQRSGLPGKDVCPRLRRLQAGRAHTARPQHRGSEGTRLDFPDVRQRQSCHLGDATSSPGHSSPCRGEVLQWQHGRATPATHAQRRWHSVARRGGSQPSAMVPSVPAPHTPTTLLPGVFGGQPGTQSFKILFAAQTEPVLPAEVASSCSALPWPARVPEVPAVPCPRPVPRGTLT